MRAKNMQVLTDDIKADKPGVVIYGIGDEAHKLRISDHNEDDTPGSRAEQSDSDNVPEHRAIDAMLGPAFSKTDADQLVARMLADHAALLRLHYIIWHGFIYMISGTTYSKQDHSSDPHNDHVHFSGLASDDENTAHWPSVKSSATPTPPTPPSPPAPPAPPANTLKRGSTGTEVRHIQQFLRDVFPVYRKFVRVKPGYLLTVDGDFGPQTEAWVKEFQRRTVIGQDGIVGPQTLKKMRSLGYNY